MGADMKTGIGAPLARLEDGRFLTGRGNYTDDINRPGQLIAQFVRSPHAAAKFTTVDTSVALKIPGVVAVLTGADMAADGVGGLPCGWGVVGKSGVPMKEPPHPPLDVNEVN